MARQKLTDLVRAAVAAVQPPAEHVSEDLDRLPIDPCSLKDWIRRILPYTVPKARWIAAFAVAQHSLDYERFCQWMDSRGESVQAYDGADSFRVYILTARVLALRLSRRYVEMTVCQRSGVEKLDHQLSSIRFRGHL